MNYKIVRAKRKTVSLSISDELEIVVRAPYFVSSAEIDMFVLSNKKWIEKAVEKKKAQLKKYSLSDNEVNRLITMAKSVIPQRVEYYSKLMSLTPTGIKITQAKKRFGSCSSRNSLCFSCYLMLYPMEAIDYVVVHELAHIKYHNHGTDFYKLIECYMPDYKECEKLLKS